LSVVVEIKLVTQLPSGSVPSIVRRPSPDISSGHLRPLAHIFTPGWVIPMVSLGLVNYNVGGPISTAPD